MEEDNNSDDDWSRSSKAAKGKKGPKGKKQGGKGPPPGKAAGAKSGAASAAAQPSAGRGKAAAANTNAAVAAQLLSLDALTDKVLEWLPEVRPANRASVVNKDILYTQWTKNHITNMRGPQSILEKPLDTEPLPGPPSLWCSHVLLVNYGQ